MLIQFCRLPDTLGDLHNPSPAVQKGSLLFSSGYLTSFFSLIHIFIPSKTSQQFLTNSDNACSQLYRRTSHLSRVGSWELYQPVLRQ